MNLWIVPIVTVLGMAGGQTGFSKGMRRFGIPGTASLYTSYKLFRDRKKNVKDKKVSPWEYCLLVLSFILAMGYGENSFLLKVCKKDYIVRLVYGFLLSIPFIVLQFYWASLLLPIAWSIRAGGFKITDKIDFLWEDLIRYTTLGICIGCVI